MSFSNKNPFDFDVSAYPALPSARGVLVTATDTEVGKTLVAGAIARYLRRSGVAVDVFKPVATGCRRSREGLVSADTEFLAACAESGRPLREITPVRYASALAPNVAAQRERRPVDLEAIFQTYSRLAEESQAVIVEGIGGLLCPITDDFWVVHLAKMMKLPVVVVARAGLGTINHTLLTLHTAHAAGLNVAGVVINRYKIEPATEEALKRQQEAPHCDDAELAMFTNRTQIAGRGKVKVLAIVPDEAANSVERATIGSDTDFAIGQVHWEEIIAGR
ncbi:MAG: dethiobiotin synthase [Phycisphaerae bacterium]|nr:dethiobiotin synthase [Phycisphaerae bacterium]